MSLQYDGWRARLSVGIGEPSRESGLDSWVMNEAQTEKMDLAVVMADPLEPANATEPARH